MAFKITQDCSNCGACISECPNDAIAEGEDITVINAEKCTECVGFFDTAQCATTCPVDAPQLDPAHEETEAQLIVKLKKLHPSKEFSGAIPSRFRK